MDISSRELQDTNKKLAESQHLARLGYWYHDLKIGENTWSNEVYKMFGRDISKAAPGLDELKEMLHPDDRDKYLGLVNLALEKGESFETEIRMKVENDNEYHWFKSVGESLHSGDNKAYICRGVILDITNRKKSEKELVDLHAKLLSSARRAGMADVATSILHNVGNILNSVNVSIGLMSETLSHEDLDKFITINKMLKQNIKNLDTYLATDEKGKHIPAYLESLLIQIKENYNSLKNELNDLTIQIAHIKDITAMQKEISGVSGLVEKVYVPEVIDTAVSMVTHAIEISKIKLIKNIENDIFVTTDKSKLLQVIVNLIQNAKEAFVSQQNNRLIEISLFKNDDGKSISIVCKDNGVGIAPENLIKIFSFGFTTKVTGHGFGLHSSALTAKELGGKLIVDSDGVGTGAAFTLTIPIKSVERGANHGKKNKQEHADYRN